MPDPRLLHIKRYEHQKLVALANIHAREIRIMELEDEIARCKIDMEAQKKVIEESEASINLQKQEMQKEAQEKASK